MDGEGLGDGGWKPCGAGLRGPRSPLSGWCSAAPAGRGKVEELVARPWGCGPTRKVEALWLPQEAECSPHRPLGSSLSLDGVVAHGDSPSLPGSQDSSTLRAFTSSCCTTGLLGAAEAV